MTKTAIIGDVHGNFFMYKELLSGLETCYGVTNTIQIGDFGFGFDKERDEDMSQWWLDKPSHQFIRGNHDNLSVCEKAKGFISDGFVRNDVMFVGGAWSIDKHWRTPGIDWWENEELGYGQLELIIQTYEVIRPRVMITHDAPLSVTSEMFLGGKPTIPTRTGNALQTMFEIHQPEKWFFGHWHQTKKQLINTTEFQCIGELDFVLEEL